MAIPPTSAIPNAPAPSTACGTTAAFVYGTKLVVVGYDETVFETAKELERVDMVVVPTLERVETVVVPTFVVVPFPPVVVGGHDVM